MIPLHRNMRSYRRSADGEVEVAAVLGLHDVAVVHADVAAFRSAVRGACFRIEVQLRACLARCRQLCDQ